MLTRGLLSDSLSDIIGAFTKISHRTISDPTCKTTFLLIDFPKLARLYQAQCGIFINHMLVVQQ